MVSGINCPTFPAEEKYKSPGNMGGLIKHIQDTNIQIGNMVNKIYTSRTINITEFNEIRSKVTYWTNLFMSAAMHGDGCMEELFNEYNCIPGDYDCIINRGELALHR